MPQDQTAPLGHPRVDRRPFRGVEASAEAQTAAVAVHRLQVPAQQGGVLGGDRQTKAAAAAAARRIELREPLEDALQPVLRHARPAIRHGQHEVPAGWFLHAQTGDEWLMTLKFRVKKNTFSEANLQRHLAKPVDVDQLVSMMRVWLRRV